MGVLAIGGLLRIIVYFQNRSLFLDEANLALNIIEKSWPAFFHNLDYQQYAPPLFLLLEKCSIQALGTHEMVFRFLPLAFSLIGLWLFYKLANHTLQIAYLRWIPVYLLALSPMMIQYASEIKQYSSDVFCTILLIYIGLCWPYSLLSPTKKIALGLLGILVIWFSMPSVFILFGLGCYYFYQAYLDKGYTALFKFSPIVASWVISFGVYYFSILSEDLLKSYLVDYHRPYFLPLLPINQEEWFSWFKVTSTLLRTSIGGTILAYFVGTLLFFAGIFSLFQKRKALLILLVFPILATLVASAFERYSLMPRLSLFLTPCILLILGVGVEKYWQITNKRWIKVLGMLCLILILSNWKGYQYFWKKFSWEDSREILAYTTKNAHSQDVIYLSHALIPAYRYYSEYHPDQAKFQFNQVYLAKWDDQASFWVSEQQNPAGLWLLFSHLINQSDQKEVGNQVEQLQADYTLEKHFSAVGAAAFYLKKKK